MQALERLQEHLLGQICGVFMGRDPGAQVPVDAIAVAMVERGEEGGIIACLLHQRRLRERIGSILVAQNGYAGLHRRTSASTAIVCAAVTTTLSCLLR
jgi:hypothetical protein